MKILMGEIQGTFGPVHGLIHGAGVLADRKIVDQTDGQFDLVYDTKVRGIRHLYQAINLEALKFLILFSSSTARFGRSGQLAYAAANEALNKWAQQQSVRLPHCRVVSYNWGPWAGGMVKDSLKLVFEKEGLSLIPLDAGARLVVDELRGGGSGPVEIVVLAESGVASRATEYPRERMGETSAALEKLDTVFRRAVDLDSVPVLGSHVIDGHAVLPMAIIVEWLAEGAVHRNPGLVVCGLDNVRLFKGVIIGANEEATLEIRVSKAVRTDGQFIVTSGCCEGHWPMAVRSLTRGPTSSWPTDIQPRLRLCSTGTNCCPIRDRTTRSTRASCSTDRPCRVSTGSKAWRNKASRGGSPRRRRLPNGSNSPSETPG